jgi:hypothetical protein
VAEDRLLESVLDFWESENALYEDICARRADLKSEDMEASLGTWSQLNLEILLLIATEAASGHGKG